VLDFRAAIVEKPERFSFRTTGLHASWFIEVDPRKFDFTDVKWHGLLRGPKGTLDEELKALKKRGIEPPDTRHTPTIPSLP
jgi:hypothetical protein